MAALPGALGDLAIGAGEQALAFGLGFALGAALDPAGTALRQEAWQLDPLRALDPRDAARIVAQTLRDAGYGHSEAAQHGVSAERFDLLAELEVHAPATGELLTMLRRGTIGGDDFAHGLRKMALDPRYDAAVRDLRNVKLSPGELAAAIHRGTVADPGLLQGTLPSGVGNVPAYPVYPIDAIAEAAASGFDRDRLGVLVGLQGLPMGSHEAAQAFFRHILTEDDYLRAIAESNTRNEWADAIREQTRQIPTARDFVENALRGYRSLDSALAGAALHGMKPEHATMIYQNQGRPMTVRLITQALARGGEFKPEPGELTDPYEASIVEGNLKPAYYDLAKALRYNYPSPFVLRSLVQTGDITVHEGEQVLLYQGWEPGFAHKVASAWGGGGGSKSDPHVGKAQTQLWTALHRSYVAQETDDDRARSTLTTLGVAADAQTEVLALWQAERALVRTQLTPAQVKKAWKETVVNPDTGAAWTRDEALTALLDRGYSHSDATTFLEE